MFEVFLGWPNGPTFCVNTLSVYFILYLPATGMFDTPVHTKRQSCPD
ncbi:MAG: hypothetical protein AAF639_15190 [Chloroflexota bacterium]